MNVADEHPIWVRNPYGGRSARYPYPYLTRKPNLPMHLLNKFLVTGTDSPLPNPRTPFGSVDDATRHATSMVQNAGFSQAGAIVWAPVRVIRLKSAPVEILDPKDPTLTPRETVRPVEGHE